MAARDPGAAAAPSRQAGTPGPAADVAKSFTLAAPPPAFVDDPYPVYAALRRHAPVHEMAPGVLLLTRYDDVAAVYRDPRASSDKKREFKPKFGDSLLYEHHTTSLVFNDPPLHTRVRRLLMGALNQRAIARMEPGVVALVDGLLDRLATRDVPDLIEDYAARIPVEVIGNLLDVPRGERGPLRDWSLAILSALEPAPSPQALERGNAAVRDFKAYLETLVERRRAAPGDPEVDVLTRLIQGGDAGAPREPAGHPPASGAGGEVLTPLELLHNCIFLLNAGHETTTNLIGNGMHALLTHRDQLERLRADPALTGSAVEELLRYESPLQLNNRVLTDAMVLGNRAWPAGTFVTLGVGAANRDPAQFPEPDRLDIGRKPNLHVAFGHGAHACAGMNVARLEARIAIGRLVERFPRIRPAGEAQRDPRVRFRGLRRLPVRVD